MNCFYHCGSLDRSHLLGPLFSRILTEELNQIEVTRDEIREVIYLKDSKSLSQDDRHLNVFNSLDMI